jgi:ribonuclease BN (tRNA processing enzyme)
MELIVLGTYAAWPGAGGAASGYLLRTDDFNLVIDLGTGAFANLQRHIPHDRIDGIVISHVHLDHCLDLAPLFFARFLREETLPPLVLASPSGVIDRIGRLEEGTEPQLHESFAVKEVEPGESFEMGPFSFETRLLPHLVPNMGMRIATSGGSMAYTGDTGPSPEIEALARGTDLLVAEASWLDGQGTSMGPIHLTARQAAEHAARARVPHLVLSHFWPTIDRSESRRQAEEAFTGTLTMAEENRSVRFGT